MRNYVGSDHGEKRHLIFICGSNFQHYQAIEKYEKIVIPFLIIKQSFKEKKSYKNEIILNK